MLRHWGGNVLEQLSGEGISSYILWIHGDWLIVIGWDSKFSQSSKSALPQAIYFLNKPSFIPSAGRQGLNGRNKVWTVCAGVCEHLEFQSLISACYLHKPGLVNRQGNTKTRTPHQIPVPIVKMRSSIYNDLNSRWNMIEKYDISC